LSVAGYGGGFGSGGGAAGSTAAAGSKTGLPKKGMQLGKSKAGASSLLESLAKEEGVAVTTLEEPVRPGATGGSGLAGTHVISGEAAAAGKMVQAGGSSCLLTRCSISW
jgi:hypothetical protein